MRLPGGSGIVVADTVGFIRELPHELVAAFQSTLQEAREAHLLLHVIDASDERRDEYIEQVNAVLTEIGAGDLPQLAVYNKIDRLGVEARIERDAAGMATQVWISAARGTGLVLLQQSIAERLELSVQRGWLTLAAAAGALRARLYAADVVREERTLPDGSPSLLLEMPQQAYAELLRTPGVAPATAACAVPKPYLESGAPRPRMAARRARGSN
jgi:GTP-binding protein HflX